MQTTQLRFVQIFFLIMVLHSVAEAATITAEKNCAVRIEGDEYKAGQFVGVYKGSTSDKPLARIRILKVDAKNSQKAIGRVLRKPGSSCSNLNGLVVAPLNDEYLPASARTGTNTLPKFVIAFEPGYQKVATLGLHTQSDENLSADLTMVALPISIQVYPLMFSSKSFLANALGLGVRYSYNMSLSAIPVQTESGSDAAEKVSGTDLTAAAIFRIGYNNDKMSTEIHAQYEMNSFKNKLSKTAADLKTPPLRDFDFSGAGLGVYQKINFLKFLNVSFGGAYTYGLSIKAPTSYSGLLEEQTNKMSAASAFSGLVKTDISFGMFSCGLGYTFRMLQAKNQVALKNTETNETSEVSAPLKVTTHDVFLSLGAHF